MIEKLLDILGSTKFLYAQIACVGCLVAWYIVNDALEKGYI